MPHVFAMIRLVLSVVSWVPTTTPVFDDSLRGLTELSRKSYFQLCFITTKGYKPTSAKGGVHRVKSGGNQVQASKSFSPMELYRMCWIPPTVSYDNRCEMLGTRKVIIDQVPKVLLGTGHIGILYLAHTKIPNFWKENRC